RRSRQPGLLEIRHLPWLRPHRDATRNSICQYGSWHVRACVKSYGAAARQIGMTGRDALPGETAAPQGPAVMGCVTMVAPEPVLRAFAEFASVTGSCTVATIVRTKFRNLVDSTAAALET